MVKIKKQKVESFIKDLSSMSSTPGGGATAALVGSFAAGLVHMVANLTIGKKGYENKQKIMFRLLKDSRQFEKRLMNLADEDVLAFQKVMRAYRLDKDDSQRDEKIQKALMYATTVPLETAEITNDVYKLAQISLKHGNKNALSDAKTAKYLANASIKSALENVKINLKSINNAKFKKKVATAIETMGGY